jgi:hypothetical protein
MATTAKDALKKALQLSEGERARVAAETLARAAVEGLLGLSWDETRTRVEERVSRTRK